MWCYRVWFNVFWRYVILMLAKAQEVHHGLKNLLCTRLHQSLAVTFRICVFVFLLAFLYLYLGYSICTYVLASQFGQFALHHKDLICCNLMCCDFMFCDMMALDIILMLVHHRFGNLFCTRLQLMMVFVQWKRLSVSAHCVFSILS